MVSEQANQIIQTEAAYSGQNYPIPVTGYMRQQADPQQIYVKRKDGLTKIRNVSVIHAILAAVTIVIGVATLGVASSNIGFPVFNVGVLLVGILHLVVGFLCYRAGTTGLVTIKETSTDIPNSVKGYIWGQFALSVALIGPAIIAAVFAFLSGAACAGAGVTFRTETNGNVEERDASQYCEPNESANAALAIIGGILCLLIGISSMYGSLWVCAYGALFGFSQNGRNRVSLA